MRELKKLICPLKSFFLSHLHRFSTNPLGVGAVELTETVRLPRANGLKIIDFSVQSHFEIPSYGINR